MFQSNGPSLANHTHREKIETDRLLNNFQQDKAHTPVSLHNTTPKGHKEERLLNLLLTAVFRVNKCQTYPSYFLTPNR